MGCASQTSSPKASERFAAAAGQLGVLKSEDDSKANLLPIVSNPMLKNNDTAVGILLKDQDGMIAGTPVAVTTVGIDNDLAVSIKFVIGIVFEQAWVAAVFV